MIFPSGMTAPDSLCSMGPILSFKRVSKFLGSCSTSSRVSLSSFSLLFSLWCHLYFFRAVSHISSFSLITIYYITWYTVRLFFHFVLLHSVAESDFSVPGQIGPGVQYLHHDKQLGHSLPYFSAWPSVLGGPLKTGVVSLPVSGGVQRIIFATLPLKSCHLTHRLGLRRSGQRYSFLLLGVEIRLSSLPFKCGATVYYGVWLPGSWFCQS